MKSFKKHKNTIYIIAILVMLAIMYRLLFSNSDAILEFEESPTQAIGEEVVKLSDELNSINFDQDILSSPAYLFLTDFSVEVPPQPTGRPNPFDIIGRD